MPWVLLPWVAAVVITLLGLWAQQRARAAAEQILAEAEKLYAAAEALYASGGGGGGGDDDAATTTSIAWRKWHGVATDVASRDAWAEAVQRNVTAGGGCRACFAVCADTLIVAFDDGNIFDAKVRRVAGPGPSSVTFPYDQRH